MIIIVDTIIIIIIIIDIIVMIIFLQAFLQQVLMPGLDATGGSYRLCLQHRWEDFNDNYHDNDNKPSAQVGRS